MKLLNLMILRYELGNGYLVIILTTDLFLGKSATPIKLLSFHLPWKHLTEHFFSTLTE